MADTSAAPRPEPTDRQFRVIDLLDIRSGDPADDVWAEAVCPAHDDNSPSLGVSIDPGDGWLKFKCHAGCTRPDILAALGITLADLGPARAGAETAYHYTDAAGERLFDVVRWDYADGSKKIRPRRLDGTYGYPDGPRPLYNLPRAAEAAANGWHVWIVEGEKAAEAVSRTMTIATCNPGGAGKWRPEHTEALRGAKVTVVADCDKAGRDHARKVAAALDGVAVEVRLAEPHDDPRPGWDIADQLEADPDDLELHDGLRSGPELAVVAPLPGAGPKSDGDDDWDVACQVVALHRGRLAYVPETDSWRRWEGGRWQEVGASGPAPEVTERLAGVRRKATWSAMVSVTNFTKSSLTVSAADWDHLAPTELPVANGVLDLVAGTLRPEAPGDYVTKRAPVEWQGRVWSGARRWLEHLARCLDAPERDYLQRALGAALVATPKTEFHFLLGSGGNGKSVVVGVVKRLLGPLATTIHPSVLAPAAYNGQGSYDLVKLKGARLAVASELEAGARWNAAELKRITDNQEMSARAIRQAPIEWMPTHSLWVTANHKPSVPDASDGFWRRYRGIPFPRTIPTGERDTEFPDILAATEGPAVLAWLVDGAQRWMAEGRRLSSTPAMAAEAGEYRAEEDALGRFLDDCCELSAGASVGATKLYQTYARWAESQGLRPWTETTFGRNLGDRGYKPGRRKHERLRTGLTLTPAAQSWLSKR